MITDTKKIITVKTQFSGQTRFGRDYYILLPKRVYPENFDIFTKILDFFTKNFNIFTKNVEILTKTIGILIKTVEIFIKF